MLYGVCKFHFCSYTHQIFVCFMFFFSLSFYERKHKVFLRLFSHQREYQTLMNQR